MASMMRVIHKANRDTSKCFTKPLMWQSFQSVLTFSLSGGQPQQYPQQPQYGQDAPQQIYDANGQPHQFPPQSSDKNAPNYDPNAPPMSEGERGLLGSIGGGVAGHYLGKNTGHGFLGTIGGAILGNLMEDKVKKGKHGKHHGSSHHGSSHGGSSWGGKW